MLPTFLILEVLQEPLVEAIAIEMPHSGEPVPVTRNRISRIKPRTYEYVCGNFRAFLRRIRVDRMHAPKFRRHYPKYAELAGYLLPPTVSSTGALGRRIGVDYLPD